MEYTKGEWKVRGNFPDGDCDIIINHPHYIETIACRVGGADANRIVKAVNCHDDLVEALKWVSSMASHSPTDSQVILIAIKALAKAEAL